MLTYVNITSPLDLFEIINLFRFYTPLLALCIVLPLLFLSISNRDICIEKDGEKVVILTSGLLDLFPVFELFINATKDCSSITLDINKGI